MHYDPQISQLSQQIKQKAQRQIKAQRQQSAELLRTLKNVHLKNFKMQREHENRVQFLHPQ